MANTPQAKKRIRRNANRTVINHSRVSRIRTFIKAVESAIAEGKKADAADSPVSAALGKLVGIERHVGAVETTDSEVDDGRAQVVTRVRRRGHLGR